MPKLYFASPLFNEMEQNFNAMLAAKIRQAIPELDIYLPQEQGEINDKSAYADSKAIARYDTDALLESDIVLAVLDGLQLDPGVAAEVGIAYQANIPVVGLYTDTRQQGSDNVEKLKALQEVAESQFSYVNLYVVGLIKMNGTVVNSSDKVSPAIKEILNR
ncbi:nucleoside 2-deoxyribosyltransferase [Fundicoccus culcitae]|uniref:Nucleoside 2-deoxyribosyltransferase n=1 Tax=Fundicoccus culcitae TaxID=2969821 RepID=A0ABY5P332_9LACT|nr:nucleoside 2-deoxyribosyltransferase [Fundicoccus culcitae]UUX32820.1 nucleoside 2-deoxyribosyltransferase [Fundicoccus culcitae]